MGVFCDHILSDFWPNLYQSLENNRVLRFIAKLIGYLAIIFLISLLVGVWQKLDSEGYVVHNHNTPVWISGDWLVGEYRICEMMTTTPIVEGSQYTPEELATLPRLFCGGNDQGFDQYALEFQGTDTSWAAVSKYFHILPVRYFGRLERPDRWKVSWRCQRKDDSLECKALN